MSNIEVKRETRNAFLNNTANFVDIVSCNALDPAHTINNLSFSATIQTGRKQQQQKQQQTVVKRKYDKLRHHFNKSDTFHKRRQTAFNERMRRPTISTDE